jgi:hypothetical protein
MTIYDPPRTGDGELWEQWKVRVMTDILYNRRDFRGRAGRFLIMLGVLVELTAVNLLMELGRIVAGRPPERRRWRVWIFIVPSPRTPPSHQLTYEGTSP